MKNFSKDDIYYAFTQHIIEQIYPLCENVINSIYTQCDSMCPCNLNGNLYIKGGMLVYY